ncbi:MAG: ABC transporter substrate-binding protein [Planctomycetes bacterium]|nr:ABC transporter substrate-binding protein [Planctomycetota bacterium]
MRAPERVISLCPSVTETLFSLGLERRIVGRTRWCVEPAERVAAVPTVGGTKNPDLDALCALAPELVLLNEEENRREDAESLEARGLRTRSHFPRDVEGARAMVEDLGALLGCEAASARLAAEIDAELRATREAAARLPRRQVAYLIWRRPWMAIGGGTYIGALLAEAGLDNVLGAESAVRYPEVDLRALVASGAEALLLSSEPYPFAAKHLAEAAEQSGLPPERLFLVDGQALSWYGARTPRGLRAARELMEKLVLLFPRGMAER